MQDREVKQEIKNKVIIPVGWTLIVKIDKVPETTRSGIFVPQGVRERQQEQAAEGTLVAIGDEAWKKFDDFSFTPDVGDRVMFAKYGGHYFVLDDQEYRLLNDQDIIGVIKEEG